MTILDKEITRETTEKIDNREIQITLTESQKISMKLKGLKTGAVEIGIGELFKQLKGDSGDSKSQYSGGIDLSSYKGDDRFIISIHDIRHSMMASDMDLEIKQKFDSFLAELISERKKNIKK